MLYEYMPRLQSRDEYSQMCYSQFGEDLGVWAWIETLQLTDANGTFVDVGAHHPRRGSNTFLVRKLLGWTGINVEPDPALFAVFEEEAPECVNLQVAVGEEEGEATLTIYNHPSANTISDRLRQRQAENAAMAVVSEVTVPVLPLNVIVERHLDPAREFRLLSIDAEGLDLEVLRSLNLEKHRPHLILIEDFDFDMTGQKRSPISSRLAENGYTPVGHAMVTTLYRKLR